MRSLLYQDNSFKIYFTYNLKLDWGLPRSQVSRNMREKQSVIHFKMCNFSLLPFVCVSPQGVSLQKIQRIYTLKTVLTSMLLNCPWFCIHICVYVRQGLQEMWQGFGLFRWLINRVTCSRSWRAGGAGRLDLLQEEILMIQEQAAPICHQTSQQGKRPDVCFNKQLRLELRVKKGGITPGRRGR